MNFQFIPSPSSPNWVILQQTFSFVFVWRLFSLRLSHGARFLFEGILFIRFCWRRFVHETNKRYHPNGKPNRRLLFRGWLVTVLQCADSLIFIQMLEPTPGTPMTRISGKFLRWLTCAGESGDYCQHYRRQKVSFQGKDSGKLVSLWRLGQKTGE